MRSFFLLASLLGLAAGFCPVQQPKASSTELEMISRRDAMIGMISAASLLAPGVANAFSQQLDDYAYEPQQQATDGRWDLNNAFIG